MSIVPRPEDSAELLRSIEANRVKLDACPAHCFTIDGESLQFGKKLNCKHCGGNMDVVQTFRYAQGFAAAGGDPNQVIHGFADPQPERFIIEWGERSPQGETSIMRQSIGNMPDWVRKYYDKR